MAKENITPTTESESDNSGRLSPHKIYIKDLSFETPHSPSIFTEKWDPTVNMDLHSNTQSVGDKLYEVVLTITIKVSIGDKVAYLVEAHQAGIFHIDGFSVDVIERVIATVCPNILFPFAREHVADLVTRGGFPQLLLAPVNFDALYLQQQKKVDIEPTSQTKH